MSDNNLQIKKEIEEIILSCSFGGMDDLEEISFVM